MWKMVSIIQLVKYSRAVVSTMPARNVRMGFFSPPFNTYNTKSAPCP